MLKVAAAVVVAVFEVVVSGGLERHNIVNHEKNKLKNSDLSLCLKEHKLSE